jgi:hypothetical protein
VTKRLRKQLKEGRGYFAASIVLGLGEAEHHGRRLWTCKVVHLMAARKE